MSTGCKCAVTELKKKFFEALVLEYLENRDPYTVTTDPLLIGVGAFLNQKQGTEDRVIACARKSLSESEPNFSSTMRKLFTIAHFRQRVRDYLLGHHFSIITDHRPLV